MVLEKWITPFKRQCFVVAGVSLNMSQLGMVFGYAAILVPQLRKPDSLIPIDEASESWVAALPGFALVLGNLVVPPVMAKFGRRIANIISIVIVLTGWISITLSTGLTLLLIGRFLQGLSVGMGSCLIPIMIGEYTSSTRRGQFSMCMSVIMGLGTLAVHTVGSYYSWKITALVCSTITFFDLIIVILSPESPSWLAAQGRYDECRRVFRLLRTIDEEEELDKMLAKSKELEDAKIIRTGFVVKVKGGFSYINKTITRKEFYKPIFIMVHLFAMGQWAGINVLAPFTVNVIEIIVGKDVNIPLITVAIDIQRIISSLFAVYIIKRIKRRTMLFSTLGLNAAVIFVTAAYVYFKSRGQLPFDHPMIGITLILIHMLSVATGSLPLPYTIAGEIFPLEYRSLSSGISAVFCSINIFVSIKTLPYLFKTIGMHGAYCLYGVILVYCLTIAWFFLPETKDRTLQDIENEFRGKVTYPEDLKSAEPLTVWKSNEEKA